MALRVNNVFDKGLDSVEQHALVRKAEEAAAGVEYYEDVYGQREVYEENYEDLDALAAVLREVNIIRQDHSAVGEPLPVRKLEECVS